MPEQSVHHQENADSNQQMISYQIRNAKEYIHENYRYNCTGRIRCRN